MNQEPKMNLDLLHKVIDTFLDSEAFTSADLSEVKESLLLEGLSHTWHDLMDEMYPNCLWHGSTTKLGQGIQLKRGRDRAGLTNKIGAWCGATTFDTLDYGPFLYRVKPTPNSKYVTTEWGRCYYQGHLKVVDVFRRPMKSEFPFYSKVVREVLKNVKGD